MARDDVGNYSMQKELLPRDAMRRRGLCCRSVSVRLSVTLVYSIHMAGVIVKLIAEFLVLISCVPSVVIRCCGLMWDPDVYVIFITVRLLWAAVRA